ncbi:MAG: 16S rRNA (guanine(966)-N(2))-methyltransferase RsmD [Gammaproteobacteria bacterium]|nr:16S rRNA (guanine(966)-N(2))-methyltransferase RsmD [Gammaproteobacteria bacterium]MCH9743318.1 16S rRNA (guanine(966)-N(2))-methyltransferase RsmD [Gammaproteobacteria bacterium]
MKNEKNTVRIIGGKWRSRKIHFAETEGLRPTHDRVRETLFNWLMPVIDGANCLDLFAGSGALGFEALSRGANKVCFVDDHAAAVQTLQQNVEQLSAQSRVSIINGSCPSEQLASRLQGQQFDIVFLDPPYRQGLLLRALEWLMDSQLLKPDVGIYVEFEKGLSLELPEGLEMLKSKQTQSLCYGLVAFKT